MKLSWQIHKYTNVLLIGKLMTRTLLEKGRRAMDLGTIRLEYSILSKEEEDAEFGIR